MRILKAAVMFLIIIVAGTAAVVGYAAHHGYASFAEMMNTSLSGWEIAGIVALNVLVIGAIFVLVGVRRSNRGY